MNPEMIEYDAEASADHNTTHKLREVLEIGCVFMADWTDEFRLHKGIDIIAAQEDNTRPFATIAGGYDGKRIATLVSFIVAEHMREGKLQLPEFLMEGFQSAAELLSDADPGADGNVGTLSDNVAIKILDRHGRELES